MQQRTPPKTFTTVSGGNVSSMADAKAATAKKQEPSTETAKATEHLAAPVIHKHASWPREVWVVLVFIAGMVSGAVCWDYAQNRNADNVIRAVTAGQAIERAKQD